MATQTGERHAERRDARREERRTQRGERRTQRERGTQRGETHAERRDARKEKGHMQRGERHAVCWFHLFFGFSFYGAVFDASLVATRRVQRPADMTAEDHTFITDDNNGDLLWDILAKLLNHRVKVVRQAAAGALAQAKRQSAVLIQKG